MEDEYEDCFSNGPPAIWPAFTLSGASDASKLRISILHPMSHIQLTSLSPQAISQKKLVFLDPKEVPLLDDILFFKVKQFDEKEKFLEYGYLSRCPGTTNAYCLIDSGRQTVPEADLSDKLMEINEDSVQNEPLAASSVQDTLSMWRCDPEHDISKKDRLPGFSMKPPVAELPPLSHKLSPYTISPKSESDPLNFLLSRYYSTLYSLTTPLSYFPKTALTRFKVMCNNDMAVMKMHLLSVYLTPDQLEERYKTKFGLINPQHAPLTSSSKYEVESRLMFASKYLGVTPNEESLAKLVLELKVREAHLQILVLMSLLLAWPIDEHQFLEEMPLRQAKAATVRQKRSLVRRKGSKKKIIPTFLGVGVQDYIESPEKPVKRAIDELSLYTSLIALVDQMGIWDSLLGRIKGVKDESMYGFLAYVLVPFFNKQLPQVVQFVVQKVKDLRPKLTIPKSKSSKKLKSMHDSPVDDPSPAEEEAETPKKSSRFAKVLLSPSQMPFLRRSATTGKELQPAFLLKRSKSNLGSKNLKRRQVDMSVSTSNPDTEEPIRSRSFLFGDARRIKSTASSAALSEVTQVGATPMKRSQSASVASVSHSVPAPKATSQVLATPSNVRVVDIHQQILETPQHASGGFAVPTRGPSVLEKLFKLAPPKDDSINITSSPVKGSLDVTPNLFLRSSCVIESSPQVAVESSPVAPKSQTRVKPGEPIALSDSPFFRSNLNGLPPPKSTKGRLFKTTKLVRKEKPSPGSKSKRALPNLESSNIPSLVHNETSIDELLVQTESANDLFVKPLRSLLAERVHEPTILTLSKSTSASFEGSDTDSDSDSDFERLLSSAPKPTIRKYSRK